MIRPLISLSPNFRAETAAGNFRQPVVRAQLRTYTVRSDTYAARCAEAYLLFSFLKEFFFWEIAKGDRSKSCACGERRRKKERQKGPV